MTGFWALFKKEVRFFAAPAIAFFVFVHLPVMTGMGLLFSWQPDRYRAITRHLSDPSLMNTFVWNPLLRNDALIYMYTTLFLFMLIQGHRKQLQTQLHMLPVRRKTLLLATFAAFAFWVLVFEASMPIIQRALSFIHIINIPLYNISYTAFLIMRLEEINTILAIASIGMFGFTVASIMSTHRWRYVAGIAAGLAGYAFMSGYNSLFQKYITSALPLMSLPGTQLIAMNPGGILSPAGIAAIFVIASMLLYERFGEV